MDRAGIETDTDWKPSATGASLRLEKYDKDEKSVHEIVKEPGHLSVSTGDKSDVEPYCVIHCIAIPLSCVTSQRAFGTPAKTDVVENGLLLLLHLAKVTAEFHAE